MAATIEAALLYAVYGGLSIPSASEKALFVVALSLVVLIVCRIAWRDGVLGTSHLKRIKELEGGIAKFELPPWKGPTGLQLMLAVMWLINLGNAGIALRAIWAALSPAWT